MNNILSESNFGYPMDFVTSQKQLNIEGCKDIFFQRIMYLINNDDESETYLKNFYEESPRFMENNDFMSMFETLGWLSYPVSVKEDLLDADLDNYFSVSPMET
jgi:hypothetical protein